MTKAKPLPDQETLKRLLDYDPETGVLTWRQRTPDMFHGANPERMCATWNARFSGLAVGLKPDDGYLRTAIFGHYFRCHRIAFKWMTGLEPEFIDHIDGERSNNRWKNLRSVSKASNSRNASIRRDNPSGYPGVSKARKGAGFVAEIGSFRIGLFSSFEDAVTARKAFEKYVGFHPNHGRPRRKHNI